jgi:DNA-binding transcriptional LysR family regulator
MLDPVTLDQLRTFIAAADEGSFSAAGRKLKRAQSVVSQTLANLEAQLGVQLFDRRSRRPQLTEQGRALLLEARDVAGALDTFKARARGLADGLEPEVSVVVDVMFPIDILTEAVTAFRAEFRDTPLRLYVEVLGAVLNPVLQGQCAFGIVGTVSSIPPGVVSEHLHSIEMQMVASPKHPLARYERTIPQSALEQHTQLVLTDRTVLTEGQEFGVLSPRTWRLADLGAKHAFLRAGLGWGSMPTHAIEADLRDGVLVPLHVDDQAHPGPNMPMSIIYMAASPPGTAGQWLIERLRRASTAAGAQ